MKPIIKYPGGKAKEINKIYKYIPEYSGNYIEPFIGGGALFFYLENKNSIINDKNTDLINLYQSIAKNYQKLFNELSELQKKYNNISREQKEIMYYNVRDMYNNKIKKEYSDAAIYFFINKVSYAGLMRNNNKGEYNVGWGFKNKININISKKYSELLSNSFISNKDYKEILSKTTENDFIFLDPPYDDSFTNYNNATSFDKEHQLQLCELFKQSKSKIMIVINKTPFIEELYKNYIKEEYIKKYDIGMKLKNQRTHYHLIITNYDISINNIENYF